MKNLLLKLSIGVVSLTTFVLGGLLLLPSTQSHAEQQSTSVGLSIDTVLSLSVANCAGLPDANSYSVTFETMPTPTGTFASNCQTLSINTNAPGYSLLAKSNTTNLEYLNPTTVDPIPSITPITSSLSTNPTAITPNHWGFAAKGNNITLNPNTTTYPGLNFTQTYTANNKDNTYSTLPTTDTQLYNTTQIPGKTDQATFWYGTNVDTSQLAGLYSTTVTYTVIGEDVPAAPLKFKEITTNSTAVTCAIASDDNAYCWGWNAYDQLGIGLSGSANNRNIPTKIYSDGVLNGLTIKQISSPCAIASDDNVYCWGSGGSMLGNGSDDSSNVPVKVVNTGVLSGLTIKQLSSNCVIASNDDAYCWGYGNRGQLGNGTSNNSNVPVKVTNTGVLSGLTIKQISNGPVGVSCAIASNDNAYCWGGGYINYGQLGNGSNTNSSVPVKVTNTGALNGLTIKQISAGWDYVCVVASDNNAYCWGRNNYGQLGDGNTGTNSNVPVQVAKTGALSGLDIKHVAAGENYTCVIASDNNAYCWGRNNYGQLGDGTNNSSSTPVRVTNTGALSGLTIKQISVGTDQDARTCVIASDNNAYCWGRNNYGQLGDGTNTSSNVPVKVINPTP